MKDKLEKMLHGLIAGVIALMTAMCSITFFGVGLDLINKPSNLDLLLGTVMTMLSIAIGAFGVVLTMYYIQTRKD
jgi:uncharacterized membrane protein